MTPEVLVELSRSVQAMPYRWPAPPDAAGTEAAGAGSCAGKHALLAQRLQEAGLPACPLLVVGPLAPVTWPDLAAAASGLLEVHECLTVLTSWAGPITVDVTWHPAAVEAGLPGPPAAWDGQSDTPVAVEPAGAGYAVRLADLREAKETLRSRLYSGDDRARRDEDLALMAARASTL